jgi:tetratricopeptide (TPR) repeat protein
MSDPVADAADRLNALQERRREVVRLAQMASLAVRIEPHLLRQLRIDCVPEADVGAEADLWFSDLVESRGADAIVLDGSVARLLREQLSREPERFDMAAKLTETAHAQTAPALQLEERIVALAARKRDAAVTDIDEALQPAVRAMRESDRRAREIARWWMRAAPRLDPVVWRSENAVALLMSASVLLRRSVLSNVPQPVTDLGALAWAVPESTAIGHIEADVELDGRRVIFHPPGDQHARIRVPATQPPIVELRWFTEGRQHKAISEVAPGTFFEFSTDPVDLTLHTLRGAAYQVTTGSDTMTDRARLCFVVMPYGKKTDFETGRTFDLDKTYRNIIKPAVTEAGLECVRADEIPHAGLLFIPMFERLLEADLVIVDLSTLRADTAYELGVRHALRPSTTIVVAESKLRLPGDLSDDLFSMVRYEHLGEGIDFGEVERVRAELAQRIRLTLSEMKVDSPVYTYLPGLQPPQRTGKLRTSAPPAAASSGDRAPEPAQGVSTLLEEANDALHRGKWEEARVLYNAARQLQPNDSYLVQRLALATYKSRQPDVRTALEAALQLLAQLAPETSNDPETVGLYGSILKRLWEISRNPSQLDGAVRAYERGFYLKNDYYNGINLAFMFNVRAANMSDPAEAITDFVLARRVRRQVLAICEQTLQQTPPQNQSDRYWLLATMAECAIGLDDPERGSAYLARAEEESPVEWMRESTREQLKRLEGFLRESPLRVLNAAA